MAATQNRTLNIEVSAFGDGTQGTDWICEAAWIFPLLMLSTETLETLRIHADRLSRIGPGALENFESAAEALLKKTPSLAEEIERLRIGMGAISEAGDIAAQKPASGEATRSLRECLWEALESEALSIEPVRKGVDKEVSPFLNSLDTVPSDRIASAQTALEEGLAEQALERNHQIREARKFLRDVVNVDRVELDPIFWAEIGWMNWQVSSGVEESIEWFSGVMADIEGLKGFGLGIAARMYAYFLAKRERLADAYAWSKIAADQWPCTGTYHERARYAVGGATKEIAKRELTAFLKKGPLAVILSFADPVISNGGTELLEACIARQQQYRQKALVSVGEWELSANTATEVLKVLPNLVIPNELLEGAPLAMTALEGADFLTAAQTQLRAADAKSSLSSTLQSGIQKEIRKRTEALALARGMVETIMSARDDMLKSSTGAKDEDIEAVRAALLEAEDNSKAQKGCGMGMGGGCAILFLYLIASFMFTGKGVALGPSTPLGMTCIGVSLLPLMASVVYYVGCMSRRMMLESKLTEKITESRKVYETTRSQANAKFRDKLEAAKTRVAQEELSLQQAEAISKQFSC